MVLYDTLNDIKSKLADVTWPFLVLHGTKDGITDIEGSKLLHEKARSTDKELKVRVNWIIRILIMFVFSVETAF